jgi:uncharacterized membrane-anchored protein
MKTTLFFISFLFFTCSYWSQDIDSNQLFIDNVENSLKYETGVIKFNTGKGKLIIPKGFRFLDKKQTKYVLTDLWGNPEDKDILGLLVPINKKVMDEDSWIFTISYDQIGFVEDDDAEDIDYNELLKEQQKEINAANPEREKQGYEAIKFIGWASNPHYDNNAKILHWAKELKFGKSELNTLNYNLRILGRKGMFLLNAVATMNELGQVKASIPKVIKSIQFDKGYKYADFDEDKGDHIAEWTIGGLVAGKILAKVGFWALIVKFWKIIAVAVFGAGSFICKKIKRKREEENHSTIITSTETNEIAATPDTKIESTKNENIETTTNTSEEDKPEDIK